MPDGRLELSFKTFDLRGLVSFVLSFGPKAELIEPPHLRAGIGKALTDTLKIYEP
jgi:predicted DNA-binding transcriptional regulator YafY